MKHLTFRARLTLIYGMVVLAASIVLLGLTYFLLDRRLPEQVEVTSDGTPVTPAPTELPGGGISSGIQSGIADMRSDALSYLLTQGGIAMLIVTAAAAGIGWLVAGRLLAPLARITGTATRIASAPAADKSLHERIGLDGPGDELHRLAAAFDTMLARLDQAFDGQRRFVANASHELRTPLTLNRSLVEVAMHRRGASEDVTRLGEMLLEVNARHERLINGLLLLARSENELASRTPVDLAEVAAYVVQQNEPEAMAAGITVTLSLSPANVSGDPVLIERLTQNLVENAIRHNHARGGSLHITTETTTSGNRLQVTNTGPTVPAYDIPAIFEPFHRLRHPRTHNPAAPPGQGLGLSIVRAITNAHGAEVTATPRDGGGLTVTITFPPAPDNQRAGPFAYATVAMDVVHR